MVIELSESTCKWHKVLLVVTFCAVNNQKRFFNTALTTDFNANTSWLLVFFALLEIDWFHSFANTVKIYFVIIQLQLRNMKCRLRWKLTRKISILNCAFFIILNYMMVELVLERMLRGYKVDWLSRSGNFEGNAWEVKQIFFYQTHD